MESVRSWASSPVSAGDSHDAAWLKFSSLVTLGALVGLGGSQSHLQGRVVRALYMEWRSFKSVAL